MKKTIVLSLLLLGYMNFAFGGNEHGNGGDVVVCRDGSGNLRSVNLLDYYEAKLFRGINVNLGDPNLDVQKKLEILANRLAQRNPKLANLYYSRALNFEKEALFLEGVDLEDIPDSGNVTIERNCKIEQIVIQKTPNYELDKRYTVNLELWKALDNNNKAGLIWHEIIYGDAVSRGISNSIASRFLNAIIGGDSLAQMSYSNLKKLFLELKLTELTWNNLWLNLSFDGPNEGYVTSGQYLLFGQVANIGGYRVNFYEDGQLEEFGSGDLKTFKYDSKNNGIIRFRINNGVRLHPDGSLKQAYLAEDQSFNVNHSRVTCKKGELFRLDKNDKLETCRTTAGHLANSKVDITFQVPSSERLDLWFTDKDGLAEFRTRNWKLNASGKIFIKNHWIKINTIEISGDPNTEAYEATFTIVNNENIKIAEHDLIFLPGAQITLNEFGNVTFANKLGQDGVVWSLANSTTAVISDRIKCKKFWSNEVVYSALEFYDREQLKRAILIEDTKLYDMLLINFDRYEKNHVIDFHSNGGVVRVGSPDLCL